MRAAAARRCVNLAAAINRSLRAPARLRTKERTPTTLLTSRAVTFNFVELLPPDRAPLRGGRGTAWLCRFTAIRRCYLVASASLRKTPFFSRYYCKGPFLLAFVPEPVLGKLSVFQHIDVCVPRTNGKDQLPAATAVAELHAIV